MAFQSSNAGRRTLTTSAVGGAMWAVGGAGTQAVLRVLVVLVLARLLPPGDFGVVAIAVSFAHFSFIFTELGVGQALVQRPQLRSAHVSSALALSLLIGVAAGSTVWFCAAPIAQFFRIAQLEPILRVIAFSFPVKASGVVAESLLQRDLRFKAIATTDVASYGIGYGLVTAVLALNGFGYWALVAGVLAQATLKAAMSVRLARHSVSLRLEGQAARELLLTGGGFSLARIANYFATEGDNLIVGRALGSSALGLYSRAYQLLMMPVDLFGGVIEKVLFPVLARAQEDRSRLAYALSRTTGFLVAGVLPTAVLCALIAPELVRVLLGEQWSSVVAPFRVFCVIMTFRATYKVCESIARAVGAVYRRALRQAIYALAVIVGALVGARWGITGVAIGVAFAVLLNSALMTHLALQLSGLTVGQFTRAHIPGTRLAAVVFVTAAIPLYWLRQIEFPVVATLGTTLFVTASVILVVIRRAPHFIPGADALWAIEQVITRLPPTRQMAIRRFVGIVG